MRCFQVDFQDGNLLNPSYSFQLNVSYILSDSTAYTGHTVSMLFLAERIRKISLIKQVNIVATFQQHIPEAKKMFEDYLDGHKDYCKMKNIPKTILVAKRKFDLAIAGFVNAWIDWFDSILKDDGYFALRNNLETGVLGFISPTQALKAIAAKFDENMEFYLKEEFSFKGSLNYENKAIWLLPAGFYSKKHLEDDLIINIDSIESGKPYLINCLKMPNLNLFSSIEMKIIKSNVNTQIATFRIATDEWATECYTKKDGVTYFKERLMPLMAIVQEVIDNDPMLKQWSNLDGVKNNSAIYFGEISPLMLWKYYKDNLVISEDAYKVLIDGYEHIECHTVPVIVFAYKSDELKWQVERNDNEMQQISVESVRKYMEV